MSRENLMKRIMDAIEKAPKPRSSQFQMKYFIIGKEPTWNGKMWACLQELKNNQDVIQSLEDEIENVKDEIEMAALDVLDAENDLEQKKRCDATQDQESSECTRAKIQLRKAKRSKNCLHRTLNNLEEKLNCAYEESEFFVTVFENINKQFPVADFEDEEAQAEYWNAKYKEEIDLRMLLSAPMDTEMIKATLALPDGLPIKKQILLTLNGLKQQLNQMLEEQKSKLIKPNLGIVTAKNED